MYICTYSWARNSQAARQGCPGGHSYIYIYIYIYMYMYIHTHTHLHMYTWARNLQASRQECPWRHSCDSVMQICTCIHTSIHSRMDPETYKPPGRSVHDATHIYIYIYIYTNTHTHIQTHTYTHTHKHTYTFTYVHMSQKLTSLQAGVSMRPLLWQCGADKS